MPRGPRNVPGGFVYHVCNRGAGRAHIFHKDADYAAFERIMSEGSQRLPMRICAYCLMPNHWHMILWPRGDGELSRFVGKLAHVHTQRYHAHYHTSGTGHLYQGRFKSFPVQDDPHRLIAWRYVERNPLRANLVQRAEDWRYSSLWRRSNGSGLDLLSDGRQALPDDWTAFVNEPQSEAELQALRASVVRGRPFGSESWQHAVARN